MRIRLAKSAGFCFGVSNAVSRISRELGRHSPIQIDGDLIHNHNTTAILAFRGLIRKNSADEFTNEPIAIRTHGTTREIQKTVYARSKTVINLTCPKVSRIQSIIKKYSREGYYTILVGDRNHPEVVSLKSYAYAGISILSTADDIPQIPVKDKYILLSQSTYESSLFEDIRTKIITDFPGCKVFNTICDSTHSRQNELYDALKNRADTVVVIGGIHSANTRSLAAIARDAGSQTLHVESPSGLNPENFADSKNVFITAGASTPAWSILDTLDRIRTIRIRRISPVLAVIQNLISVLIYSHILTAAALYLWGAVLCRTSGIMFHTSAARASAVLYILFSLAADYSELPLILYANRNRYILLRHPLSFIAKGALVTDPTGTPMKISTLHTLVLRILSMLPLPIFITAQNISAAGIAAAASLYLVTLVPMLTADSISRRTDIITGRETTASYGISDAARIASCITAVLIAGAAAMHSLPSAAYINVFLLVAAAAAVTGTRYTGFSSLRRYEKAAVCAHTAAALLLFILFYSCPA